MPMYDFKSLSPLDFEELVRDLLQSEYKLVMEGFGPGRDRGINIRFSTAFGSTIIQAKRYTGDRAKDRLIRAVAAETPKVQVRRKRARLVLRGWVEAHQCPIMDNYWTRLPCRDATVRDRPRGGIRLLPKQKGTP